MRNHYNRRVLPSLQRHKARVRAFYAWNVIGAIAGAACAALCYIAAMGILAANPITYTGEQANAVFIGGAACVVCGVGWLYVFALCVSKLFYGYEK